MSFPTEIGTWGQWAAATATFLAVLVALFKDEFLRRCRRPRLTVSIELGPPDCHKTKLNYEIQRVAPTWVSADCFYFRLWVRNLGKTRAEQVQVFAAKLSRKSADGLFKRVDAFLPMNLKWSHGRPDSDGPEIFAQGISPMMGKHCDLGHVVDPRYRKDLGEDLSDVPAEKTIVALELEFPPGTRSHLIPPGTYRLELHIAAANSTPITKILELTTTGEWFPDEAKMFTDGLGITVIQ